MFELLILIVFILLMGKTIGLAFKLTWGIAKVAASILVTLALPVLFVCFVFAGGIVLLLPVGLIATALGIAKGASL